MLNSKALDSISECGILIYDQNVDFIKKFCVWLNIVFDVQTQCGDNKIFSIEFHNLVIFYFMFITGFGTESSLPFYIW